MPTIYEPQFEQIAGADFYATAVYAPPVGGLANLIGCTLTTSIQDEVGVEHELVATIDGTGLNLTFSAAETETWKWAGGLAYCDINVTKNGLSIYTNKIPFFVTRPVTTPPFAK